jgi:hypothetical protein
MISAKAAWDFIWRCSPYTLSFLVHAIILIVFTYITWYVPQQKKQEDPGAAIILHGEKDDRLRFQGRNLLDRFKVKDHMVYPLSEIDYNPVLPNVKFYPEPKVREEIDLIGVEAMNRKWLNPSTGRQPLYTGEEKLAGSFSRHIQVLREGGLDVVFVFDSTSSMAEFLRHVKIKIINLIATFKKLVPTARIGMVTYRDVGSDFVTRVHRLTHGTRSLQNFLQEIEPSGGGDREEAVDEALRVAIEELNWGGKSKKIILLIGDAPPHKRDLPKARKLIKKFRKKMHGAVAALDTSRQSIQPPAGTDSFAEEQQVMDEFRVFAELGGGESARLIDEEKVIRQMVVLVFGTRWEVCLDEFLKNL